MNDTSPEQEQDVSWLNEYHESNEQMLASFTDVISTLQDLSHDLNKNDLNQHQGMGNGTQNWSIVTILEARVCSL